MKCPNCGANIEYANAKDCTGELINGQWPVVRVAMHSEEDCLRGQRDRLAADLAASQAAGRDLMTRYDAMAAENARLAAIIERLPVTADGVTVVPGMTLWHCSDAMVPHHVCNLTLPYCMGSRCYSPACQGDSASGRAWAFDRVYSTREAAAAAEAAQAKAIMRKGANT